MATDKNTETPPIMVDASKKIIPLTRARFLSGGKPKSRIVSMPEWEDENGIPAIRVRALTGGEQDQIGQMTTTTVDPSTGKAVLNSEPVRARALVWCCLDPLTGEQIFTLEDVFLLAAMDGSIITRLYQIVLDQTAVKKEEVEETVKGFPKTLGGTSSTT